jgi:hypothetical protein
VAGGSDASRATELPGTATTAKVWEREMEPRAQAVSVYIDGQPRRRAQLLLLSVVSLPVLAFSAPVHLPYIYPVHPDIQTSSTSRLPCPPTTSPIPPAAHRCAVFCARLPRPTKHCASRATTATFAPNCLIRRRARCLARPLATLQDTSSLTAFWRPRPARRPLLAARCSPHLLLVRLRAVAVSSFPAACASSPSALSAAHGAVIHDSEPGPSHPWPPRHIPTTTSSTSPHPPVCPQSHKALVFRATLPSQLRRRPPPAPLPLPTVSHPRSPSERDKPVPPSRRPPLSRQATLSKPQFSSSPPILHPVSHRTLHVPKRLHFRQHQRESTPARSCPLAPRRPFRSTASAWTAKNLPNRRCSTVPLFRCFGRLCYRLHSAGAHARLLCRLPICAPHACNQAPNSSTLRFGHSALTYLPADPIPLSSHRRPPTRAARVARNRLSATAPSLSLLSRTAPLGRSLCALFSAEISRGGVQAVPAVEGSCPVSNLSP